MEQQNEIKDLKYDIISLETLPENKSIIYSEYTRFRNMNTNNDEYAKTYVWLRNVIRLPFDRIEKLCAKNINNFLQNISKRLDEEIYGMKNVKEDILMFIHSKLHNQNLQHCSIGLIGAPGTGKTSIARIVAKVLKCPFSKIELGNVVAEHLRGSLPVYLSSEPSIISKKLIEMKVKNGIMLFDELEKVDGNTGVVESLIHLTDTSQNFSFEDLYFRGIKQDLSNLWFFYSMNKKPSNNALADRIYYVQIQPYTFQDKVQIVKNYLLKQSINNLKLKKNSIKFNDKAIELLINTVSKDEKGVRTLKHSVNRIVNRIHFLSTNISTSYTIKRKIRYPCSINKKEMCQLLK